MGKLDVSEFAWVNLKDWSKLIGTDYYAGMLFIKQEDIDKFIETTCKDISENLDIPYEELMPIIISQNTDFYEMKKGIYGNYHSISKSNSDYAVLMSNFKIPTTSNLESCFRMFESLSEAEKNIFLSKISNN